MSIADVMRFRSKWQLFLKARKEYSKAYPVRSPPGQAVMLETFVREHEDPIQKLWNALSEQERQTLIPILRAPTKETNHVD